jgi:hypothetical protein
MPARNRTTKTTTETTPTEETTMPATTETTETTTTEETPETTEEGTTEEGTTEEGKTTEEADKTITVNVAIAIKIDPAKWSLAEVSQTDLLVTKIMAEKGITKDAATPLAEMMIEHGLADLVTKTTSAGGANDVRREIREFVLAQVAALGAFTEAGAGVELNEARRTNHAAK